MNKNKKIFAWIISAITILTGVMISPTHTKAAEGAIKVQSKIIYEEMSYQTYSESWGVKAPIKDGYFFGGWYEDANGDTAIKKKEQITEETNVYAKFVPANLLSVKAQNFSTTAQTDATDDKTTTRMVSSIDSSQYFNVGFEIVDIEGNRKITDAPLDVVYEKLQVVEEDTTKDYTPQQIFGTVSNAKSQKFIVLSLRNIPESKWNSDIYVRPYWTTYDGIRVYGLGKYVYVQDGLDGWISVPINLHTGVQVAAGMLEVIVPRSENYTLTYQECRVGRVFSEVTVASNMNKIKCIANVSKVEDVYANDLYAVLRFKVEGDYEVGNGTFLDFIIDNISFCNIDERMVPMNILNIRY